MKQVTKKEQQLVDKLTKMELKPEQFDGIMKLFRTNKDEVVALDQGHLFKDINDGKKIRPFMFTCSTEHLKKRGVYKINFDGKMFYIGRSKLISQRIKQHEAQILNFFTTNDYVPEHYLSKVFEYLKSNPMAYYFDVQLLEECYTVDELQIKEQKWLDKNKNNPHCLNVGFIAHKPTKEIDETVEEQHERMSNVGVAKRGGRFIFYPKKKLEEKVLDGRIESFTKSTPKKKQQATGFTFNVPEVDIMQLPTVFKLYCGDHYIIHKGKTLGGGIFHIQRACGYFIAYNNHKLTEYDIKYYQKFFDFVRKHPDKPFRVEVLVTTEDAYEILVQEQLALNAAIKDKKNLNNNLNGYIPVLNEKTGLHGWITVDQVNRFYDFLSSL